MVIWREYDNMSGPWMYLDLRLVNVKELTQILTPELPFVPLISDHLLSKAHHFLNHHIIIKPFA